MSDHNSLIVVTGATGWLGRSALHELATIIPEREFTSRVRAYASGTSLIKVSHQAQPSIVIPVEPLSSLADDVERHQVGAVLHTAFLRKEYIHAMGVDAYINANRAITNHLCEFLGKNKRPCRLAVISSGAAAGFDGRSNPIDELGLDPYGVLKYEEEQRLTRIAPTLVIRAYGVTGRFITNPRLFALGNFLIEAIGKRPIKLHSPCRVFRGYGHAGDMTRLALRWLLSQCPVPEAPVAAVSQETDLLALAELISAIYALPDPIHNIDPHHPENRYTSNSSPYINLLRFYGITPLSLCDQIADTALGIISFQSDSVISGSPAN
ncbi:NAD(P)-dependent oxidoreductase [Cyanobium sp. Morenito 9A2]|uniref:NAD-dependent epimerase/dehydratase family protein n=1 Tax=Cyanobium sp. Morenito 9A2 TaxID=2823718 RepID=UPI0020CE4D63|nr:NAD-dependent epimerase/dehydratase family protein [Cyanobium sp. Morenito 9A2]MCP9848783.1 NAD(P)-dependent oxidoreductase [Cyanobium sp. Morenito 9A2]